MRMLQALCQFCAAIAILVMIVHSSAYALSAYQSGFNHGVSDARDTRLNLDGCHWYILKPGNGFKFHSFDFVEGYVNGFCSIAGPHISSDDDEATWDCAKGPSSASWVTEK